MKSMMTALVLLAMAGSAHAKEVLVCETKPAANTVAVTTQDTIYHCPKIEGGKTLPELYRLGWRLIQMGGNARVTAVGAETSMFIILEKD